MLAHQVVFLAPTKSALLIKLLSCQHPVPTTPLNATLVKDPASVDYKRLTANLSPLDATFTKTRGGGRCSLRALPAAGSESIAVGGNSRDGNRDDVAGNSRGIGGISPIAAPA